jgi:hypothetical protein
VVAEFLKGEPRGPGSQRVFDGESHRHHSVFWTAFKWLTSNLFYPLFSEHRVAVVAELLEREPRGGEQVIDGKEIIAI